MCYRPLYLQGRGCVLRVCNYPLPNTITIAYTTFALTAATLAATALALAASAPPCGKHCQRNHILFRVWLELDRTTVFATGVLCLPVQPVHDHGSL